MSRAAPAKTRGADKTKPPASQTPVIAHEIVPGKFNDNDWNNMLDKDGADEFIMDIIDELMEATSAAIYSKYIERQLFPFTITQARDAITEIIEWQFLARDAGEQNIETDLGWSQDEEPEPAVTDCWAQGSVPKNIILPPAPLEEIAEEPEEATLNVTQEVDDAMEESKEAPETEDVVSVTEEQESAEPQKGKQPEVEGKDSGSQKNAQSKKFKFRPYRGKLKSAGVSKMTQSLEETEMKLIYDEISATMPLTDDKNSTLFNMPASCTSILKVQSGRPPGNKDVAYDEMGNVVAVMKLDPEKLPTHKVSVKYHVVDPAVEAAQARLDAMRKGKSTGSKVKKVKATKAQHSESVSSGGFRSKTQQHAPSVAPLPPPLIEEMEVAHGVVIREGGRVKKGPGRYYRKLDILDDNQKGMKPVSLRVVNPGITVADLLDRHTPILRPLGDASPLPPIVPHPPQQTQQVS